METELIYKYTKSGRIVHLIQYVCAGALVCDVFVDDETEEEFLDIDNPYFTQETLFESPPQYKEDERKKRLITEIADLTTDLDLLNNQMRKFQEEIKKYKGVQNLKNLWNFLENKITHLVVGHWYDLNIFTLEEALGDKDDRWSDDRKLISLFGKSDGDLEWRINAYRDDSGCYRHIIPCTSYEEAFKELKDMLQKQVEEWRASKNRSTTSSIIRTAAKYKVDIDADYLEAHYADARITAEKEVEKTKELLKEKKTNLRNAQKTLDGLSSP